MSVVNNEERSAATAESVKSFNRSVMNYQSNLPRPGETPGDIQEVTEDRERSIKALTEWKLRALVQLEYFRTACTLYNFCDASEINKLLNT